MSEIDRWRERRPEIELAADLLDKLGVPAQALVKYAYARDYRNAHRAADVIRQGAEFRGVTPEELLEVASVDEPLGDVLEHVLSAVGRARSIEQVRGLARVLAQAKAGDAAQASHLHVVVDAIELLDPLKLRALLALEAAGPAKPTGHLPEARRVIAEVVGEVLSSPIERALQEAALINPGVEYNEIPFVVQMKAIVTPFGRRVLSFLSEHNPERRLPGAV